MYGPDPIGVRRLCRLVDYLPLDGPYARALSPSVAAGWTNDTHLLALIAEILDAGNLIQAKIHTKKGTQLPRPMRIPRPGAPKPSNEESWTLRRASKVGSNIRYKPKKEEES